MVTDARGNSTEFHYDKAGNVWKIDYPDGTSERSFFDGAGNLVEHYDGKDRKTTFQYDENDRLLLVTLHDSSTVRYYYDKNGNVTQRDDHFADTNQKDTSTYYKYDRNNRPIRVSCIDSGGLVLYQHKTVYNFINQVSSFHDLFGPIYGSGVKYAGANIIGEVEGEYYDHIYKYSPADGSGVKPLKYGSGEERDLLYGEDVIGEPGEITPGETDIAGRVKYGMGTKSSILRYDHLSRITEYSDYFGNKYYYGYDKYSRLAMVRYPNNIFTEYSFDEAGRLSEISHQRMESDGTRTTLESFSYTYDANGNITRITKADGSYFDYTYDEWNRLTCERWLVSHSGYDSSYKIEYSFTTAGDDQYGDTGNICSKSVTGPWALWWNGSWNYKAKVKVTNSGESELTGYQVKIVMDTAALISAGKMQADCDDIRVVNEDQDTELDFWVNPETVNTTTTEIWVEVPSLAVGDTEVYIYYGNSSASSASDGDNVFVAFDDFDSGGYTDKWTVVSGTWSESGGVLVQSSGANPANIKYKDGISLTDYILETKAKKTGGNEGFLITFRAGDYLPWWNLGGWGNTKSIVENIDGTEVNPDSYTTGTWYNIMIKVIHSDNRYIGYVGTGTPTEQWDVTDTTIGQSGNQNATKISLATWNTQVQYDNWRIRKYTATEPSCEIINNQTKPTTNLPLTPPTPETTSFVYDDYNKLTGITYPDSATETLTYNNNGQLIKSEKSTGEVTTYEWNDQGMLTKVILPTGEPVEYYYDGNQRLIGRKDSNGEDLFVQSGWDIISFSALTKILFYLS